MLLSTFADFMSLNFISVPRQETYNNKLMSILAYVTKWIHIALIFSGVYLICVLATSMITLALTVVVLRLHHGNPNERVPAWIQNLVVCMATVTFQRSNLRHFKTAIASDKNDVKYSVITNKGSANGVVAPARTNDIEKETNKIDFGKEPISVMVAILDEMKKYRTETVTLLQSMLLEMRKGKDETTSVAWATAAIVFDRFCAVIFLFVILIINIVMLVVMPTIDG